MKVQGDPQSPPIGGFLGYDLASNASLTSGIGSTPVEHIASGSYLWALVAGAWNSSTIKLQYLGPDEATWLDAKDSAGNTAQMTANGQLGVVVGGNATLRLVPTGGSPTGVYSKLS